MFTSFILKYREMRWSLKCYRENFPFMLPSYYHTAPKLFHVLPEDVSMVKLSLLLPVFPAYLDLHSS